MLSIRPISDQDAERARRSDIQQALIGCSPVVALVVGTLAGCIAHALMQKPVQPTNIVIEVQDVQG